MKIFNDTGKAYICITRHKKKLAKMERGAIAPQGNEAGHYGSLAPSHPYHDSPLNKLILQRGSEKNFIGKV